MEKINIENSRISIDNNSGFCWGVVQTVEKVEECLKKYCDKQVYVLGEIIHNPHEIKRLSQKNLKTINYEQINQINPEKSVIVIRAHGEPPSSYSAINNLGIELIDATCPLVQKLQNKVLKYYKEGWQIVIFGKYNHAEVIGLRGVCNDECIVVMNFEEALQKVNFTKKTVLCSQTTMDSNSLIELEFSIKNKIFELGFDENNFIFLNTVCKFVINREKKLQEFAKSNDLILFVAGRNSSNGKVLFGICKSANSNSILVENFDEIDFQKLKEAKNIGITGATSTPKWLLVEIYDKLTEIFSICN